jgi:hypothetical protein
MELSAQLVEKTDTRLPLADVLLTEQDMRNALQLLMDTVQDLTDRITLLENK